MRTIRRGRWLSLHQKYNEEHCSVSQEKSLYQAIKLNGEGLEIMYCSVKSWVITLKYILKQNFNAWIHLNWITLENHTDLFKCNCFAFVRELKRLQASPKSQNHCWLVLLHIQSQAHQWGLKPPVYSVQSLAIPPLVLHKRHLSLMLSQLFTRLASHNSLTARWNYRDFRNTLTTQ